MTSEPDMSKASVRIIGAGLSGLVLGQCLRRRNIPAVIYEKSKESPTRNNYGITLYPDACRALQRSMDLDESSFSSRVVLHDPAKSVSGDAGVRVNKAAVMRVLQDQLDIRWETKIEAMTTTSGARRFTTDQGHSEMGSGIVVGADGVHSAVRKSLGLTSGAEMKTLPYIVFNSKRRLAPSDLKHGLEECFDHPDGILHRQGDVVLSIKADFWDAENNTAGISYTLSRPATSQDRSLLERNVSDAETLASHFVEEVRAIGELPQPFSQAFDPASMGKDRLLHWLMRSSLLDGAVQEHFAKWRGIVLMGDAVHAQPIVGGSGANAAILDAVELAEHIRAANEVDAATYVDARAEAWKRDQRQAEQAIGDLHMSDVGTKAML